MKQRENIAIKQRTRYVLVSILSILLSVGTVAAQLNEKMPIIGHGTALRKSAKTSIASLQSGALLVRLQTKKGIISKLREVWRFDEADAVEADLTAKNIEIVAAFKQNFDFCPVYFFYSDDAHFILDNQLDSIHFMDVEFKKVSDVNIGKEYFVAEFGKTGQWKEEYVDDRVLVPTDSGQVMTKKYYGGPNFELPALVIMNNRLEQLQRPFPYYTRSHAWPFRRSPKKVVKKMNAKLHLFRNNN